MTNYAITITFIGTAYCGWQVQKNALSVQQVVQDAVEKVFGQRLGITGCSRTDAGVHANEYVFHVKDAPDFETDRLCFALNTHLPPDIAAVSARQTNSDFHARYSAKGKEYIYKIWNGRVRNPFTNGTAFHYPKYIDCDRANIIAKDFYGEKDFKSFMSAHSKIEDCVRDVWYFRVERDGEFVYFTVAANGFLYNMVRIMSGTLLGCLSGRITDPLSVVLEAKDRSRAGVTLPAHGLYLNKVFY